MFKFGSKRFWKPENTDRDLEAVGQQQAYCIWAHAADYIEILRTKFIPKNFPDGNVVLQQDGTPAHTPWATQAFLGQEMDFWAKDLWPPEPRRQPLNYAFWLHIEFKA
ncbi:Putative transposable element, partial [Caligus rogercresseyi]